MNKTPEELIQALRQYMHNDGSDFVAAYDMEEVNRRFAALKEENERLEREAINTLQMFTSSDARLAAQITENAALKARVAELERMRPAYCVASGRYDSYMNELYSITDKPIPMADNFVLYRKEPANEG